tara:strand:- start:114 stop:605 length:492 start_codon:yes stop_codon:yes gene_type:complete
MGKHKARKYMNGLRRHPSRCHCKGPETQMKLKKGLSGQSPFKFDFNLDTIQTGLSLAGMVPVIGNIADLTNAAISGGRAAYAGYTGDEKERNKYLKEMGYNALAMVEGTQGITGARVANKVKNAVLDGAGNVASARNNIETIKKVTNSNKENNKIVTTKKQKA